MIKDYKLLFDPFMRPSQVPGHSKPVSNRNEKKLLQTLHWMSFSVTSLDLAGGESYLSVGTQLAYSTVPADWTEILIEWVGG